MEQSQHIAGYPHLKLLPALYFILDLFSRPNMPFFLLDETAKCAFDNKPLTGDHITVGIRQLDKNKHTLGIMYAFQKPEEIHDDRIIYNYNGIKIIIKIIDSTEPMFTSLNRIMYEREYFPLPNPFMSYWNTRTSYEKRQKRGNARANGKADALPVDIEN